MESTEKLKNLVIIIFSAIVIWIIYEVVMIYRGPPEEKMLSEVHMQSQSIKPIDNELLEDLSGRLSY